MRTMSGWPGGSSSDPALGASRDAPSHRAHEARCLRGVVRAKGFSAALTEGAVTAWPAARSERCLCPWGPLSRPWQKRRAIAALYTAAAAPTRRRR